MDQESEPLGLEDMEQRWNEAKTRTAPAWQKAFESGDRNKADKALAEHQALLQEILDNANIWKSSTGDSPRLTLPRDERSMVKMRVDELIRLVLSERKRLLKLQR